MRLLYAFALFASAWAQVTVHDRLPNAAPFYVNSAAPAILRFSGVQTTNVSELWVSCVQPTTALWQDVNITETIHTPASFGAAENWNSFTCGAAPSQLTEPLAEGKTHRLFFVPSNYKFYASTSLRSLAYNFLSGPQDSFDVCLSLSDGVAQDFAIRLSAENVTSPCDPMIPDPSSDLFFFLSVQPSIRHGLPT